MKTQINYYLVIIRARLEKVAIATQNGTYLMHGTFLNDKLDQTFSRNSRVENSRSLSLFALGGRSEFVSGVPLGTLTLQLLPFESRTRLASSAPPPEPSFVRGKILSSKFHSPGENLS